jgi:hypothetical protein
VENEDGEVLKKYDLPTQKPQSDLVNTGLKYMGMGVFAKAMDKSAAESSKAGEPSTAAAESAQNQRKKSVVADEEEEDDKHIRFTIGGFGRRMTKEDFIQEIQKLDKPTRREVVDQLKALGTKPDPNLLQATQSPAQSGTSRKDHAVSAAGVATPQPEAQAAAGSHQTSRSSSPHKSKTDSESPSSEAAETEVERRRRLAALQGVGDDGDDEEHGETAAERRRREAALGMAPHGDGEDSDDDDTPRVPPSRKSIRFADVPDNRGRTRD